MKQENIGSELTVQEIKSVELTILKYVAEFCEKNNINYVLSSGTLIGAVRHKGFIPWDLDIDISMLREDYERFLQIWKDTEDYALVSIEKEPACALPFAKIVDKHTETSENGLSYYKGGLWIDIFPLDGVPKEENEIVTHYNRLLCLIDRFERIAWLKKHSSFLGRLFRRAFYSIKYGDVSILWESVLVRYKRLLAESKKYPASASVNVTNNMVMMIRNEKRKYGFPKTTLTEYIYAPFEDGSFRIPKDYDSMLRSYYGNYMELPPVEKRTDHGVKAFSCSLLDINQIKKEVGI